MRKALLLVVMALAGGCRDQAPPPPTLAGMWHLTSIGGEPLPWRLATGNVSNEDVIAGTLTLNADGTFAQTKTLRTTVIATGETSDRIGTGTGSFTGPMETGPITLTLITPGSDFIATWTGTLTRSTLSLVGFDRPLGYAR